MISYLKTLFRSVKELLTNQQQVYLSCFYWDKKIDDFTCELLFRGRISCVDLSHLVDDSSICNKLSSDSRIKISRLMKAKSKFKFVCH